MARAPAVTESEVLPEVDRLDGYPHPRETPRVYGHAPAERALVAAIAAGRMHHAWLLTGRMGIGKATLAYRLARFLLARADERTEPVSNLDVDAGSIATRQVLALSHPGLLVLRRPWLTTTKRFAMSIPIDEVRRLRGFLGHTAAEGTWRVVIVDTADDLNPNAANALLKSLEEPPARTVFILLASEPGRLLPTIRSRCRVLPLAPLGLDDLRRAAIAAAMGREISFAQMEPLADGSVRRLLELSDGTGAKLHERIQVILSALPKVDWTAAHALADDLGSPAADQRFETFFTVLLSVVANAIRNAAAGAGEEAPAWSIPPDRAPAWAELWETIGRDKEEAVELNLDRRALILSTLSGLAAVARA
jgi:DNA polymerase III subunit delta'